MKDQMNDGAMPPDEMNTDPSAEPPQGLDDELGGDFVSSERKPLNRTTALMFLVVVAGVGGVLLMRSRSTPKAANAADAQTSAAMATVSQFLTEGATSMQRMRDMLLNTEKVVARFHAFPSAAQVPLNDLKTNPFRFAADPPKPADQPDAEAVRKQLEAQKQAALATARSLKLQSVMCGQTHRSCVIDGQVYSEGDHVKDAVIEKITPASVIVKCGQFRFEVRTQR